ncbi:malonyl-ACP O-methyltransferase BioC [Shimazuella kribbensis]|uniref:malonyl-ACP O-methyltransferase BioC n=1 Tax=Shimazuella kribbensis TaxID=139808 RepID=UPI00041C9AC2|nr:malonyl-ACP O-methyltransferase BioC [Shimazuella kribbensis]
MMISKVRRQFSNAAKSYDQFAVIQNQMATKLVKDATEKGDFKRILEVGCGTGNVTQKLLHAFPEAMIDAVDLSSEMIKIAQKKCRADKRLRFFVCDIEKRNDSIQNERYDCIISNATFQWLKQPQSTISKLVHLLQPNGSLLVATFGPKTFIELKKTFVQVEKELQLPRQKHQLPMYSLGELRQMFCENGLHMQHMEEKTDPIWYESSREFLYSVKSVGASYSKNKLSLGKTNQLMKRVLIRYDEMFSNETGQVCTTYHTLYLYGKKVYEKGVTNNE